MSGLEFIPMSSEVEGNVPDEERGPEYISLACRMSDRS